MKPEQNNRFRSGSTSRRESSPRAASYESHGPDVTIRGGAQQVAEKYLQLARDAYIGDNRVAAENYLQHAEHYFRLIAAAQEQLRQNQPQQQQPRTDNDIGEEAGEDDNYSNFGAEPGFAPQPQQFTPREQPQPYPQPREQPQPRGEYREPRESRQPQAQADTGASGLPSFITGGGAQPVASFEPGASAAPQGERFAHRRRRPRGPRPETPAHQDSGDVASE